MRSILQRKESLQAYAVLLVFNILLLAPLWRGRALYWGDILLYFEPMARYGEERLRRGEIPLWNPYVMGGQPYVGNPQMWVFYPTTPLQWLLPAWLYLSTLSILHIFLSGVFCRLYLLRWTRNSTAALMGAMVYMGSACLIARLQFPPMAMTAPYFPLILWLVDRQIERPSYKSVLAIGITVALTILAAHAQMGYLLLGCAILYTLSRLWSQYRQANPANATLWVAKRVTPFLIGLALAVGLCAVQVLPVLQLLRESPRVEMTAKEANRFFLEARQLLTLFAPRFVGHPASGDYRAAGNAWEPALFVGWLPLVALGYVWARRRREQYAQFWVLIALLSIWLAFGMAGGLFPLAFALFPGLSKFHDPARFLFLTTFALAVLTTLGAEKWLSNGRGNPLNRRAWLSVLATAFPLAYFAQDWNPTVPPPLLAQRPALLTSTLRDATREGRLYLPSYNQLWKNFVNYNDYGARDAKTLAALLNTLMPNMGVREGVEFWHGYEPVPLAAPLGAEQVTEIATARSAPNLSRLLALYQANTLLRSAESPISNPRLVPLAKHAQGGIRAYHNLDATPRAWFVGRVRRVEGRKRVFATLTAPDFEPRREAIVSLGSDKTTDAQFLEFAEEPPPPPQDSVHTTQNLPHALTFKTDSGDQPRFLVCSSAAYPGWKAFVDNAPTTLYRTNGATMGLWVPKGKHTVTLRFAPAVYRVGLYLSLATFCLTTLGAGFAWGKERRKSE